MFPSLNKIDPNINSFYQLSCIIFIKRKNLAEKGAIETWVLITSLRFLAPVPFSDLPGYFPNISEMFPGGFLSPGRFIAPGIFHHELLRWGNGKEVHFSSTNHHLFDTCLHIDNHTHFTELENHCSL